MKKKILILLLLSVGLMSCSKNVFVVSKESLDPFTVYSYQPLALPPIYYLSSQEIADERRFIKEGKNRVQSLLFESQMRVVLPPRNDIKNTINNEDTKFLKLANADKDLSQVREKLEDESLGLKSKDPSFIDKLFSNYKGEALDDKLSEYKKYNP